MEPWFQVVLTIFSSVLASSGLWAYLQKKSEQKDVKTEMLIGLAHDRIMSSRPLLENIQYRKAIMTVLVRCLLMPLNRQSLLLLTFVRV